MQPRSCYRNTSLPLTSAASWCYSSPSLSNLHLLFSPSFPPISRSLPFAFLSGSPFPFPSSAPRCQSLPEQRANLTPSHSQVPPCKRCSSSAAEMMGCFTALRSKKKKGPLDNPLVPSKKSIDARESTSSRLPEPEVHVPSLQSAPPSFRNRAKISQSANKVSNSRARVLSAPSTLIVVDQFGFPYAEYKDQDDSRDKEGSTKGHRFSNPLPLPLPSPEGHSLRNFGSFKASNVSGPLEISGPLPLPLEKYIGLRIFSYEEVSSACQWFSSDQCVSETLGSTSYKATFRDDFSGTKTTEATVARLLPSTQSLKEFKTQVNTLASLEHPNLCKLIGYYAKEDSNGRMLVYERLHHGSLDKLLFGRPDGRFMDWSKRLKVALGAARGLAFLHDEGPFQAMYSEFSTSNIQIDKDFTAKLSGYGCAGFNTEEISNAPVSAAHLSVETLAKGLLTPKSNVWSFGVVLLELITGRKNLDVSSSKEERNIVKWSRPFLTDDSRLSLIMDSRIKGRFPTKAARIVADIILKCLHNDPSERPTMRDVVEALTGVQEIKVPCRYPLQEPSAAPRKRMLKSTSLNGIVPQHPVITFSPSPPSHNQPLISPRSSTSALLHPRTCYSTLDDPRVSSIRKTPPPIMRRSSVEGF